MAKILVADDNSNIQKMVGLALKDQGIDVVAVGNGEAAVRKISDIRPDLVLADVFMPVRNGYEVCRYVKEDSALAHIPVILLVGAFDPLDEQEAQQSGADGVLKKPFVPPDPLISMVKSALQRAGVPLGKTAQEEKAQPPAQRSTAEILGGGVSSKLAALAPEKLPEIMPEPVEEFPTAAPQLKIAAGSEPLAFGSLLETPEAEDLSVTSKPMINLSEGHKWNEEPDEVQEEPEEEEESVKNSWRPGALDEEIERVPATTESAADWRDEAFHGNSPAEGFSSAHWNASLEQTTFAETSASQSVAVATVETKAAESAVPFSGDAWAAAMAAGVEEKLGEIKDVAPAEEAATAEGVQAAVGEVSAPATETMASEQSSAPEMATAEAASEPANWAPAPETAWEVEAKKASVLASTWDSPKTYSPDETQEVPVYSGEAPVEAHTEHASEAAAETREEVAQNDPAVEALFEAPAPKSWENTWEAPSAPVTQEAPAEAFEAKSSSAPEADQAEAAKVEEPASVAASSEPDMDELVARVLGKMNPEVLQRVTREILKPVIEAIVRDEINSKKS